MKKLLFLLTIFTIQLQGQSIAQFKTAIDNPKKKVQAIHKYPEFAKGECHFVEITSIDITGDNIVIVETWSAFIIKAKTTLIGKIKGNVVEGTWSSNYSSGTWSYDFSKNAGEWNKTKTKTSHPIFPKMEYLLFKIVDNKDIIDGHKVCK